MLAMKQATNDFFESNHLFIDNHYVFTLRSYCQPQFSPKNRRLTGTNKLTTVSETGSVFTPSLATVSVVLISAISFSALSSSHLPIMNTPIDPSQQTPLHNFADTLSKWCRKAIVPRRNEREEDEQEEGFSFGVDDSMWDTNSMWHLYDDDYKADEECEDWDEKAMLDVVQQKDVENQNQARSTSTKVDEVFEGKGGGEWNDAEVVIDSAEFDEASVYSDQDVSWSVEILL